MSEEKLNINVQIGGFPIALHIDRKDEEIYRKAERLVTKLINDYHTGYSQLSYEDILKLVAYQLAVQVSQNQLNEDPSPLADRLKALTEELDSVLDK